jgi:hypothetical protein
MAARDVYDTKYDSVFADLFGAADLNDLRTRCKPYRMKFHPDKGGDPEAMIALNAIVRKITAGFISGFRAKAAAYTPAGEYNPWEKKDAAYDERLAAAIRFVMGLSGDLTVEVLGTWVWVGGKTEDDTRQHSQAFKAAGFKFSGAKKRWYWGEMKRKWYGKKTMTMEEIRRRHPGEKLK